MKTSVIYYRILTAKPYKGRDLEGLHILCFKSIQKTLVLNKQNQDWEKNCTFIGITLCCISFDPSLLSTQETLTDFHEDEAKKKFEVKFPK
jgi:hypothetical protein